MKKYDKILHAIENPTPDFNTFLGDAVNYSCKIMETIDLIESGHMHIGLKGCLI